MTPYRNTSLRYALTLVGLSLTACNSNRTATSPSAGYVFGSVSDIHGNVLPGVTVRLTPSNEPALTPVKTNKTGFYAMFHVPAGTGTITISDAPTGCTGPAISEYYVPANAPAALNITVLCP